MSAPPTQPDRPRLPWDPPEHFEKRVPDGDNRERLVCGRCEFIHYQNPKVVAGAVCTGASAVCAGAGAVCAWSPLDRIVTTLEAAQTRARGRRANEGKAITGVSGKNKARPGRSTDRSAN